MKSFLFLAALCFLSLLGPQQANAQGWVWGRATSGSSMDGLAVAADATGNVFTAGVNFGGHTVHVGGDTIKGATGIQGQIVIAKYSPSGDVLWAKGTQVGVAYTVGVATDTAGNLILLGLMQDRNIMIDGYALWNQYYSFPVGRFQYFLAKFDPDGHLIWAKTSAEGAGYSYLFRYAPLLAYGGVTTDSMGNIFITRNFNVPITHVGRYDLYNADTAAKPTEDIFVAKYGPDGTEYWATRIGGKKDDRAFGIALGAASCVYVAGHTVSDSVMLERCTVLNPNHKTVTLIAEVSSTGDPTWAMAPTMPKDNSTASAITSDNQGSLYVAGIYMGQGLVFDTTSIHSYFPSYLYDATSMFFMKLSPDHKVPWGKSVSAPKTSVAGYGIATSSCGVAWVSGAWCTPDYFGFGSDSIMVDEQLIHTPDSSTDPIFILGFDPNGMPVAQTALQSGGDDQAGLACDPNGNVLICSDFYNNKVYTDFVIGHDVFQADSVGVERQYVAKFSLYPSETAHLHTDTAICNNDATTLLPPPGYQTYVWSTGVSSNTISISGPGTWWVYCQNNCTNTILVDTMKVNTSCNCICSVPNAFSPNNDGLNDGLRPFFPGHCAIANYNFKIFNRWGNCVFTTTDPTQEWRGEYNGERQPMEVYVYEVSYTSSEGGQKEFHRGNVTLIR